MAEKSNFRISSSSDGKTSVFDEKDDDYHSSSSIRKARERSTTSGKYEIQNGLGAAETSRCSSRWSRRARTNRRPLPARAADAKPQ